MNSSPPEKPQVTPELEAQAVELGRGAVDVLPDGALAQKLATAGQAGRPLRVKLGIDPTAPDIHLGHTVVLSKLRDFQDAGHTVVLIIGDYTARVGDPSGRSSTRPVLSDAEIDANAKTFQEQASKVLSSQNLEVRFNSEWLDMAMSELFKLTATTTVAQLLERDDFAKRYAANTPISVLELLYPLLQGYDSVAVKSDVELGGTDQKFNLLLAREIQRAYAMSPQAVLTMPILPGTDGVQRMSKSTGNYIGVTEPASEIYGKTLSLPDTAMAEWFSLLFQEEAPADQSPRDAKRTLARRIAARFHSDEAANAAEAEFDKVHIRKEVPDEIEEIQVVADGDGEVHLPSLISAEFDVSGSEARRLIKQGGVRIDGEQLPSDAEKLPIAVLDGVVLQVGKRRFKRIRLQN